METKRLSYSVADKQEMLEGAMRDERRANPKDKPTISRILSRVKYETGASIGRKMATEFCRHHPLMERPE